MKKSIKLIIGILIILETQNIAIAQKKKQVREAIYVQIGGAGISMMSFNYSRQLIGSWHGRVGLGFSVDLSDSDILLAPNYLISMPLQLSYLIGGKSKFLELSGGFALTYVAESTAVAKKDFYIIPSAMIGYRRQPLNDGFLFRVNAGVVYFQNEIQPLLGLSFGFVLN